MEIDGSVSESADEETMSGTSEVYIPGISRSLKDGEELKFDKSAYVMLQKFHTAYPCLSFDPLPMHLNDSKRTFELPFQCSLVAGSQAGRPKENSIYVIEMKNLQRFSEGSSDEEESSSDEEENKQRDESKCQGFRCVRIPHHGDINRMRLTRLGGTPVCAVWNALGKVQIWNLSSPLRAVKMMTDAVGSLDMDEKPIFTFTGHLGEGYAMDWSSKIEGHLVTGDCRKNIHLWKLIEGGKWQVEQRPYSKHTASVEDVQWSNTDESVFFSCSADKSIKFWDSRAAPKDACIFDLPNAHEKDVNVISLNNYDPLLLSGGDDGELKVWDLRTVSEQKAVAVFSYHQGPVTSVQWCPHDRAVFAAAGEDNSTSLWDITAQPENDEQSTVSKLPPQLLFLHLGQKEVKEIRWSPDCEGVLFTTALDGFNIFKTVSI